MNRLSASVRPRSEVSAAQVERMYALYAAYYAATAPDRFAADLQAKDYVIELTECGELRGFSTLAVLDFYAAGAARRAIYSGDTIIEHRFWGEQALAQAFCRFAGTLHAADPATPLCWFLITKGHRTYRYLSVFAHDFAPHPERASSPIAAECIDVLARNRFGTAWKPELGIVRFDEGSRGHLDPKWTQPRTTLALRPEVRFFLDRNPGHARGDELCCLTELTALNLRSYARRAFLEGHDDDSPTVSIDRGPRAGVPAVAAVGARGAARAARVDPLG
jgi:hypothetical protein